MKLSNPAELLGTGVSRISMPDTSKAIYGKAAKEYLINIELWNKIEDKIIPAATVPQVSSYIISKEVDAGFINLTDAIGISDNIGGYFVVDNNYSPIEIVAGTSQGFEDNSSVKAFIEFLETEDSKIILDKYGALKCFSSLIFSCKIIFYVCFLNIILGSITGVFLAKKDTVFTRIIDILVSLPMVFPPIALGFFLLLILGRSSFLGRWLDLVNISVIFSPAGVLLAAFVAGFPLMVKSVKTSASSLDNSMLEMAELQGASRIQVLLYIIIPNIRTGIFSGLTLSAAGLWERSG